MSDKKTKKDRIPIGALVDKKLYQRFKARAALQDKPIGEMLDEALDNYLAGSIWPDDNDNEEGK